MNKETPTDRSVEARVELSVEEIASEIATLFFPLGSQEGRWTALRNLIANALRQAEARGQLAGLEAALHEASLPERIPWDGGCASRPRTKAEIINAIQVLRDQLLVDADAIRALPNLYRAADTPPSNCTRTEAVKEEPEEQGEEK